MRKRAISISLLVILIFSFMATAFARYDMIVECTPELVFSRQGDLNCILYVEAKDSEADISGTLVLKKDGLLWDTTVEEWDVSGTGNIQLAKTVYDLDKGDYILTADIHVESKSGSEDITKSAEASW